VPPVKSPAPRVTALPSTCLVGIVVVVVVGFVAVLFDGVDVVVALAAAAWSCVDASVVGDVPGVTGSPDAGSDPGVGAPEPARLAGCGRGLDELPEDEGDELHDEGDEYADADTDDGAGAASGGSALSAVEVRGVVDPLATTGGALDGDPGSSATKTSSKTIPTTDAIPIPFRTLISYLTSSGRCRVAR
jgi:hypothetical protein